MTKEEKLARKQQRKAEKVGLGKLLLWNSSSCSVALSTLMLGYATFYCTDVLQLAPALVGTLFMVSKIFDSFTDVVAGFIVDRTQTRWGSFHLHVYNWGSHIEKCVPLYWHQYKICLQSPETLFAVHRFRSQW